MLSDAQFSGAHIASVVPPKVAHQQKGPIIMSVYTGRRTPHALARAQEFCADHSLKDGLTKELAVTKRYTETQTRPPSFSFLANMSEATSHRKCANVNDVAAIDWARWRLASELCLL